MRSSVRPCRRPTRMRPAGSPRRPGNWPRPSANWTPSSPRPSGSAMPPSSLTSPASSRNWPRKPTASPRKREPPPDPQPAAKAADDLRAGDADAAQERQDQSARELERLAENLQRGIETAKDPREAAQQLGRLQDENRKRLDRPAEKTLARQQQEA